MPNTVKKSAIKSKFCPLYKKFAIINKRMRNGLNPASLNLLLASIYSNTVNANEITWQNIENKNAMLFSSVEKK